MDFLRMAQARGRYLGMELELITPNEAHDALPAAGPAVLRRRAVRPGRGPRRPDRRHPRLRQVRPAGRRRGPPAHAGDRALASGPDGTWDVHIENGDPIHAEHVVNAGGLWAREVGRMVGIELPVLAMEHMYLLTEDMPEVAANVAKTGQRDADGARLRRRDLHPPGRRRRCSSARTSRRACRGRRARRRGTSGRSSSSRTSTGSRPSCQVAFKHYPAMGTIGIRKVVNGPFTFSPDGNPLVGPVRGLRGYWVACGVMAGLSQGGGVGLALATWMTAGDHGDSGMDIWAMDVARYGDYATLAYTNAKVQENYRRRFRITFPNEELPAGAAAPDDADPRPADRGERGLGRDVRPRARAVVPGGRARAEGGRHVPPLERLGLRRRGGRGRPRAGRDDRDLELRQVPGHRPGRRGLAVVAADRADAGARPDHADRDAQRRGPDRRRVHRRPRRPRPTSSTCSARCRPRSTTRAGSATTCRPTARSGSRCSAWGSSGCRSPGRARATSSPAVAPDLDLSTEAFPFMTFRRVDLGMTPAHLARINYSGDLGYELWVAPEYQRALFDRIVAAGRAARAAAVRDAGADVAPAREELRDVVPRVPPDLHARSRAGSRATSSSTTSSSAGRRTRPSSRPAARSGGSSTFVVEPGPGRPGRRHRRRADLARRRGRRLGDVGRLRPPRQGSRSRSATSRPSWRRPTARAGAASRSRSSAGAGRPGSSPSRCSTRRVSGCASDAPRPARPNRVGSSSTAGRSRSEPGDSVAIAILRAGEVTGSRRDAVPGRRLRQLPRRGRRRRLRPDLPDRLPARARRSSATRRPGCRSCRPSAARMSRPRRPGRRSRSSGWRSTSRSSVAGGAAGRGRGRWRRPDGARPRCRGGRRGRRDLPRADRRRPDAGGHAPRPGRPRSIVATGAAEVQPVCPGNELDGLLTSRAAERLHAAGIGLGTAVAIGAAPAGVPCQSSPVASSGSRATPAGCGRS